MKKTTLLLAVALFSIYTFQSTVCQAQNLVGYRSPNPGIMNPKYEMAIQPQFDDVNLDFSDGIACVMIQRGQRWSYINTDGKPIFSQQYLNPHPFHYGVAAVEDNRKWGFLKLLDEAPEK